MVYDSRFTIVGLRYKSVCILIFFQKFPKFFGPYFRGVAVIWTGFLMKNTSKSHKNYLEVRGWGSFGRISKSTFGTFRRKFCEKLTKIFKKGKFFPNFCQILEKKKLFFLVNKFEYFFKKCQKFFGPYFRGVGVIWTGCLTKSTAKSHEKYF